MFRVLLLERLDAVGAAPQDAALRAAALRAAGGQVRTVVIGGERAAADGPLSGGGPALDRVADDEACRSLCQALIPKFEPQLVILASAGETPLGAWLASRARTLGWPTALLAPGDPRARRAALPTILTPDVEEILSWAPVARPRGGRALLPLWDGDYVMAAGPLEGAAGVQAIEAFTSAAEETDAHDLVVLADPQPEFEARARSLGIGPRVHFAGPARRDAEHAWLRSASAVLIAGDAPLSAGLLLRSLAAGAPLLPIGESGVPGIVAGWLARRGYAETAPARSAGRRLQGMLDRDAATERSIAHGVSLAAALEDPSRLERLAAALDPRRRDVAA